MKEVKWKPIASKDIFSNPWLSLRVDDVYNDSLKQIAYAVVDLADGASILAIDPNDNVYLTKQYRYALGAESIETPGGKIDVGETPKEAAKREMKEELNIVANNVVSLGTVSGLTGNIAHTEHLFLTKLSSVPTNVQPEVTEGIEQIIVPFEQAVAWALDSTIVHGPALVLILRAKAYLDRYQ